MQRLYVLLAVVGFAIPVCLLPATVRHRNLLLMARPAETLGLLFGNYASAAFAADLLWVFVVLAFLFGVSGPFPLFLYYRERKGRR